MRRRIGTFLCVALCISALGAVAASGANAFGNTTGFLCAAGTGGGKGTKFSDATCKTPAVGGAFGHGLIALGFPTQLTLAKTGAANFQIKTKIALLNLILTIQGVECVECMVENNEEMVGVEKRKDLTSSGTLGHLRFTGVTTNVKTCDVEGGVINTEPLDLTSVEEGGVTKIQFVPTEEDFATVLLEDSEFGACVIPVGPVISGFARATTQGTIAKFATGNGELAVGVQKAELTGEAAMSAGETGGAHSPLALTEA
jgi:hypothetical protein